MTAAVLIFFCLLALPPARAGEQGARNPDELSPFERLVNFFLKHRQTALFGRPHSINFLPIFYYDFLTGLNLGFRSIVLANDLAPYRYRLSVQMLASLKGSHKHKILFDFPNIRNSAFGIRLQARWERDLQARYFGLGNDSINDESLTSKGEAAFIDENFYLYNLKRPAFTIYATYEFLPAVFFWFGYGVQQVEPQLKNNRDASFLGRDRPFGHLGGRGWHLSLRLNRDTRDDDVFPARGYLTEIIFEPNFATVSLESDQLSGLRSEKQVSFQRYTFSHSHFMSLDHRRLIIANRIAFEAMAGEAPYYAFGEIAGEQSTRAVGGSQSLRGYPSRRFQDKIRAITLSELRWQVRQFSILSQQFDLILVGFVDNGRVWRRWSDLTADNVHTTFGAGVWLNWNSNLIIRADLGRSPEGVLLFFRLGSAF